MKTKDKIILIRWQSGLWQYVLFNDRALYYLECHQDSIESWTIVDHASLIEPHREDGRGSK